MSSRTNVRCAMLLAGLVTAALTPAVAQAQISGDAVRIGVLNDMNSIYADSAGPGSLVAAQMAVKDFGGTVAGKPIEVVSADHQNKPDVGAAIARRWFDQDGVDVIVDVPTSSVALAVQQIARDKNRVLLISGGGSSDLTGPACSPVGIQWTYDTYALSHVAAQAMVKSGGDSWAFITADYAFGQAMQRDASAEVKKLGGTVLGDVRVPLGTPDFSSFLLQVQGTKAKVIGLANAGSDTQNAIKQAGEFGLVAGGQKLVALLINIDDVHSLGAEAAQGLLLATPFYWDMNDDTRAFSKRFYEVHKSMPTMHQAGVYSAVSHYLKAIQATGTDEAKAVVAKMKATPIHDFFAQDGYVREDGRMVHEMYLMQVKTPAESKGEWDLYKQLAKVPGDEAFRPMSEGGCPFVTGAK